MFIFALMYFAVFDRLIDYMPLPPATEDGSLAEVPNLEFTKVLFILSLLATLDKSSPPRLSV